MAKSRNAHKPEKESRWSRRLGQLAFLYLFALAIFVWAYAAGRYQIFPHELINMVIREVRDYVHGGKESGRQLSWQERLTLHKQERASEFDFDGLVVRDLGFTDNGYLLLSRFSREHGQSIVELVRISGFQVLHQWIPPVEEILDRGPRDKLHNSSSNYRPFHPLLMPDGSIITHSAGGPLIRLDRDSGIVWMLPGTFHHSTELTSDGNIVVPIILDNQREEESSPPFRDDGYAVVSPGGTLLETYSLTDILLSNGYRGLIMGVGEFERDRYHLNDVQPIRETMGSARVGDVALSIRHISTVMLFRPSENKVVWLKTGPWLNQHDVNLLSDGKYSVFGNDMYRLNHELIESSQDKHWLVKAGEVSEVYIYDAETDEVTTPYTIALTEAQMYSPSEGRSRVLRNGDVYIEDTVNHRLLRVSSDRVRWEYVNTQAEGVSGGLNWCRYLAADEIQLGWLTDAGQ